MEKIQPIAIPGIHKAFIDFFKLQNKTGISVLDAGAGHGAMTKTLDEAGFKVVACDFNPEFYYYDKVPFIKADLTVTLPFENEFFDAIVSVEVMEHIFDHEIFFSEAFRILKHGGQLFVTTPNILSLKSRFRFLFSGFFYSFSKLDENRNEGLQHLAALSFDQYKYLAQEKGFKLKILAVDKKQNSSRWLMLLYPLILIYTSIKKTSNFHNSLLLLTGRILFLSFEKP